MSVPQKTLAFFIVDSLYRSLYKDADGTIKKSSPPVPLKQHAKGWMEMQIKFGTNQKYWSLLRSFTIPLTFVNDGADICRYAIYSGKGYEEELYVLILSKNEETGVYDLEYRGRLDFSKAVDEPRKGVTIPTIEGGVLSYLTANDGVPYEIPLDPVADGVDQTFFDGVNLFDRFRYSIIEFPINGLETYTLPFPFISNEGNSVGILFGTQQFEHISDSYDVGTTNTYTANSANYPFDSIRPIPVNIKGTIYFKITPNISSFHAKIYCFLRTSLGNNYPLIGTEAVFQDYIGPTEQSFAVDVDITVNLAPNEKIFTIAHSNCNLASCTLTWLESNLYYSFTSRNAVSTAYCIEPLALWKKLVFEMTEGNFTGDSVFLASHKNLVFTSTDALRQAPSPVIKYTVADFFNDWDCLKDMAIKVRDDVLWLEPKESIYNDDGGEIFDIGELSELKLSPAEDLICNTGTFGYKTQDYRQANGKYEFNTTTVFKFPVNTVKRDYNKVLKARGDCLGIEYIRAMIFDKATTDTTGDNQAFIVNVKNAQEDITTTVSFISSLSAMIFENGILIAPGDQITVSGSIVGNDGTRLVTSVAAFLGTAQIATLVGGLPLIDEANVVVTISFAASRSRVVYRAAYSSITGVLDDTIYNIEEMSPHRLMLAHKRSLAARMEQLGTAKIVWKSSDKNADLSTTLAGVTISEKQDEVISMLGDPLWLNYYASFKTAVLINFSKILSNIGTGYIKGSYRGVPIYFLPIGNMTAKPAFNEPQTWKLLLAANNDLETLRRLSDEGIFTIDTMGNTIFTSDLNPLHFNKYGYSLPAKYHHKEMYDARLEERLDNFISDAFYAQKWQRTENIPIQVITRGLGIVDVEVYDSVGNLYSTNPMVVTADPAVNLPYVKSNYILNISSYPGGYYLVVLSVGGNKLRISEWLEIREDHPGTLLFEYSHTGNRQNTYFTGWSPNIRVEATMLPLYPDSEFTEYKDELMDIELLDGKPMQKRMMILGNGYGVPDWMANKISKCLLLNRCNIEGVRYSRMPDDKFAKKEKPGHPLNDYRIEIARAINNNGLSTDEAGSEDNLVIVMSLNMEAFGGGDGTIMNIETTPD